MKSPLTINILVKNNEDTIVDCLESIKFVNCEILIGDLGCTDKTISLAMQYKPTIVKLSLNDDLSNVRNSMIKATKTEWIFVLNPYETFLSGQNDLMQCVASYSEAYKCSILQGNLITKETRLWHKNQELKYKNPVYETVGNKGKYSPIFVNSWNKKNKIDTLELAKKWYDKNPFANESVYYLACSYLTRQNWDSFIAYAELYLHQEKNQNMSYFMTHYYLALVNCYVKKNYTQAIQSITTCILKNPVMAEFWCLLGDIYYAIRDYKKAANFYDNASIIGKRRKIDCDWFMEISKYEEYPAKMKKACEELVKQTSLYVSQ